MNTRERFKNIMAFKPVDRLPMIESYWWWNKTVERWHSEGLPQEINGHMEIAQYFGLDKHRIFWLTPAGRIQRPQGRPRSEGVAHTMDEYLERVKPIFTGATVNPDDLRIFAAEQSRDEVFVWLQIDGFFWFPREVFGIEPHLFAFHDQPELMHCINEDILTYNLRIIEEVCSVCVPDVLTFAEDMSYNHGPMISKAHFDEFLAPYYRRIVPVLHEWGILPFVDSDGDIEPLIPWLEEVGLVGLTPLERMAGNDVNNIRQNHPQFRMLGAFDKTVMHRGADAIRAEFERLLPLMKSGGYIPSVDHQTPPEVSLENYRLYVSILKEYVVRAVEG